MPSSLRLRQVRSPIGSTQRQLRTLQALGLGRTGSTSERPDETSVRGMIEVVRHLVEVQANDAPASN